MTTIDPAIVKLIDEAEGECRLFFDRLDQIERHNTRRVLASFQKHRVSSRHFAPTTGSGYDDIGRDTLSAIMAELLKAMGRKVRVIDPAAVLLAEGGILESSVNIDASKKRYEALGDDDPQSVLLMAGFAGGDASGRVQR